MSESNDELKAAVERLRRVEKDGLGLMAPLLIESAGIVAVDVIVIEKKE